MFRETQYKRYTYYSDEAKTIQLGEPMTTYSQGATDLSDFTVYISPNVTPSQAAEILVHEMVHVQQDMADVNAALKKLQADPKNSGKSREDLLNLAMCAVMCDRLKEAMEHPQDFLQRTEREETRAYTAAEGHRLHAGLPPTDPSMRKNPSGTVVLDIEGIRAYVEKVYRTKPPSEFVTVETMPEHPCSIGPITGW